MLQAQVDQIKPLQPVPPSPPPRKKRKRVPAESEREEGGRKPGRTGTGRSRDDDPPIIDEYA